MTCPVYLTRDVDYVFASQFSYICFRCEIESAVLNGQSIKTQEVNLLYSHFASGVVCGCLPHTARISVEQRDNGRILKGICRENVQDNKQEGA